MAFVVVLIASEAALADDGGTLLPHSAPAVPMIALTVAWVFAVGASVGSFLNVVVYRLPLGMNLSSPGSRCPVCETPIERRDNVPVFGWLWLRGRCRACSAPISSRYPLVEAATGLLVVALLFAELSSGGGNLPVRAPNEVQGLVWHLWGLHWDLIALFAYHATLVFLLVVAGLIAFDGQSARRLFLAGVLIGLLPPLVWPHLHPVPFIVPAPEWTETAWIGTTWTDGWIGHGRHHVGLWLVGAVDGLLGVAGGLLLGAVLAWGVRDDSVERTNLVAVSTILGAFVGWQSVWSIGWLAGITWIVVLAIGRVRPVRPCPSSLVCIAGIVHSFAWRPLFTLDWWPSERGLPALGAYGWGLIPLIPLVAASIARTTSEADARSESDGEPSAPSD